MLSKTHLAVLLFVASCASAQRAPTMVEDGAVRRVLVDSSEELSEGVVRFSATMAELLGAEAPEPPVSNSYSHQRLLGPRKRLGEPQVHLEPTDVYTALSSTDCSGWLSFVLNTVSPLHEAVLQSQREREEHNRSYSGGFALREHRRPWARAFVVTQYLRSDHVDTTGFAPVDDFEKLRPGDIGAYAMGRYAKPTDESRPKPRDTGHVFIVTGNPTVVDPEINGYSGRGSLKKEAAKVIAVPIIDSSATLHFDPDSRKTDDGGYALPEVQPHSRAKPGGVGTGTVWFALSEDGHVLQRRLGPHQRYRPVLARAARLRGFISLDDEILDDSGALLVRVFENAPDEIGGVAYGAAPVHLTGKGGLRLASGRLVLRGHNDFSGGVTVQAAELVAASPTALGRGDVSVRGGSLTLREPAIDESATLSVDGGLADGSIVLDFKGRNVVQALQLGHAMHRCGTWGGPESDAMFVDPVFAGRGVIELAGQPLHACTPGSQDGKGRRARRRSPRRSSNLRASRR